MLLGSRRHLKAILDELREREQTTLVSFASFESQLLSTFLTSRVSLLNGIELELGISGILLRSTSVYWILDYD